MDTQTHVVEKAVTENEPQGHTLTVTTPDKVDVWVGKIVWYLWDGVPFDPAAGSVAWPPKGMSPQGEHMAPGANILATTANITAAIVTSVLDHEAGIVSLVCFGTGDTFHRKSV